MGNIYSGANVRLAFAREQTWATKPEAFGGSIGSGGATPRFLGIVPSTVNLPDPNVDIRQYRSMGAGRQYFKVKGGRRERNGSIPILPTSGEVIYFGFGNDVFTTKGAGTHNIHQLSPKGTLTTASPFPSFAMSVLLDADVPFQRTYLGCMVDGLNLSLSENGELSCTMDIMARSSTSDTSSPTVTSSAPFTQPSTDSIGGSTGVEPYMFFDTETDVRLMGTYTANTTPTIGNVWTGGRTFAGVKSFNISLRNNLKRFFFMQNSLGSSRDASAIVPAYPTFEASMELVPQSFLAGAQSIYDLLTNDTPADILLPFSRPNGDKLHIVLESCLIASAPHHLPEDGAEISVPVTVRPKRITFYVYDQVADYDSL